MYTLRLLYASEGYRRIAWITLAAVTIWRAGYFYKGYTETFFALDGWLEDVYRLVDPYGLLLYIVFTIVEIILVIIALVVVIELVAWILIGFNSEFGEQIPELPIELKIKYLKNGSFVLKILAGGLVGFLFMSLRLFGLILVFFP